MSRYLDKALTVTFVSFYTFFSATLLHNFISGFLNKEEPFFFLLAVAAGFVFPFAFVFASICFFLKKRQR